MNFPPAGTRCADCKLCVASIYAEDVPICWHCDAGEPCPGSAPSGSAHSAATHPGTAPRMAVLQPHETPRDAVQHDETRQRETPTRERRTMGRKHISEEVRAAIRAADPNRANSALARQYGISDMTVGVIRREAGIRSTAKGGREARRGEDAAKAAKAAAVTRPASAPRAAAEIRVTICSTMGEEKAKAIFARLAPHLKQFALEAALLRQIEEA